MNPAFALIDLQEDFFADPRLGRNRASIVSAANALCRLARARGHPVIWVRQEFEPDLSDAFRSLRDTGTRITIRGTEGCAALDGLERHPSDHEIIKRRYSAFFGTPLAALLQSLGVTHLVIGGINSHACVRTTAVDAFQLDYRVVLATETIASYDEQYHSESMRYLAQAIGTPMTNADIEAALSG